MPRSLLAGLSDTWREIFSGDPYARNTYEPRPLTEDDRLSWDAAMDRREPPKTKEAIQRALKMSNPVRWRQVQNDLKWVQKRMKKMGLNPEDARYIL